jgi:hypothetical protein
MPIPLAGWEVPRPAMSQHELHLTTSTDIASRSATETPIIPRIADLAKLNSSVLSRPRPDVRFLIGAALQRESDQGLLGPGGAKGAPSRGTVQEVHTPW